MFNKRMLSMQLSVVVKDVGMLVCCETCWYIGMLKLFQQKLMACKRTCVVFRGPTVVEHKSTRQLLLLQIVNKLK